MLELLQNWTCVERRRKLVFGATWFILFEYSKMLYNLKRLGLKTKVKNKNHAEAVNLNPKFLITCMTYRAYSLTNVYFAIKVVYRLGAVHKNVRTKSRKIDPP